jgi:hypothetical protein
MPYCLPNMLIRCTSTYLVVRYVVILPDLFNIWLMACPTSRSTATLISTMPIHNCCKITLQTSTTSCIYYITIDLGLELELGLLLALSFMFRLGLVLELGLVLNTCYCSTFTTLAIYRQLIIVILVPRFGNLGFQNKYKFLILFFGFLEIWFLFSFPQNNLIPKW